MAKVQKSNKQITSFAGIYFIEDEFDRCGLSKLIDKQLGIRNKTTYSFSEIFKSWSHIFLCGGSCAEDIQKHLRQNLQAIFDGQIPSADTLLRGVQELATQNTCVIPKSGKEYKFNINLKMNDLNIKSLILTKQLKKGEFYDFDYDNQIIEHEKWDAKRTYKQTTGYFPGIASIGDKIVYVENRDGNANVKTNQDEILQRAYKLLNDNGIYVNRSRMDAGSYSKNIIKVVAQNSKLFYIRANKCESLTEKIAHIEDWKSVEINYKNYEVASIPFEQFLAKEGYRLVIMREKNDNQQLNLFEDTTFTYRCILTNDHKSTEKEVIEYYNERGASEKIFDVLNNDFGWGHLPCSEMNYNTVYLILTALIKNFYNYFVRGISKVFKDILPTSRIKRFIFSFISVSGKWIKRSRQRILLLYTDRPYEKVKFI